MALNGALREVVKFRLAREMTPEESWPGTGRGRVKFRVPEMTPEVRAQTGDMRG